MNGVFADQMPRIYGKWNHQDLIHHKIQAMRYVIFVLLISLSSMARATISAPISHVETAVNQQTIPHGFAPKKQRFFERLLEKKLAKRLTKAVGASKGDGRGLAIGGLIAFLISVVSWVVSPLLGFTAGLPMALLGLLFSVICLSNAKPWDSVLPSRLAILGIVLNGVALIVGIAIYIPLTAGI